MSKHYWVHSDPTEPGQDARLCVIGHRRDPERPRKAVSGMYLCKGCLERLRNEIAELPRLHDALAAVLPASGFSGDRVSGSPTPGLPYNPDVYEVRDQITHDLRWWARDITERFGVRPPPDATVWAVAAWLGIHLDRCARHPWIDEMHGALCELRGRALSVYDRHRNQRRVPTTGKDGKPCPCVETVAVEHDGETVTERCPGVLLVILRELPEPCEVICDTNPAHVYDTRRWLKLGKRIREASGASSGHGADLDVDPGGDEDLRRAGADDPPLAC